MNDKNDTLTTNNQETSANRNYKDTVFRFLFRDPKNLLDLYNALHKTHYTNPEDLKIVTLENALYFSVKNDLAFILDSCLYLYEHQSTWNPNMPLRDLIYVTHEYQVLHVNESIYQEKMIKLFAPKFIVFYNGDDKDIGERQTLRLSDAFYTHDDEPNF